MSSASAEGARTSGCGCLKASLLLALTLGLGSLLEAAASCLDFRGLEASSVFTSLGHSSLIPWVLHSGKVWEAPVAKRGHSPEEVLVRQRRLGKDSSRGAC